MLYHGTSAGAAFRMARGEINPGSNSVLYCFDSGRPEGRAGALCFATGGDLRKGCADSKRALELYYVTNPDFPRGLKGEFFRQAMKLAIGSWKKRQKTLPALPHGDLPAIITFAPSPFATARRLEGFIHETLVPAHALSTLKITSIHVDDSLVGSPEAKSIRAQGIPVLSVSAWQDMIVQDALDRPQRFSPPPKNNKP